MENKEMNFSGYYGDNNYGFYDCNLKFLFVGFNYALMRILVMR